MGQHRPRLWSRSTAANNGSGNVQADKVIDDNHEYFLSHCQKMSNDGQKSFQHVRLDKIKIIFKGMSVKIVRRHQTEKRLFSANN